MAVEFPIINPPGPYRADRRKRHRVFGSTKPAPLTTTQKRAARKRTQAAQRRNR